MALHSRFVAAFGRLLTSWRRHDETQRDPERVVELGAARAELEDARTEVADARDEHHPDWQRSDAPTDTPKKTSATSEEIAKLRLRGDSFGHRG